MSQAAVNIHLLEMQKKAGENQLERDKSKAFNAVISKSLQANK